MVPDEDLEVFLQTEIAASRSLDWLCERIFAGEDPNRARAELKRLANVEAAEPGSSLSALHFLRGMRIALAEDEFRWLAFTGSRADRRQMRRQRLAQYHRYRELFELEIRLARKLKRSRMALSNDWSSMESYLHESAELVKAASMLWAAGILYKLEMPGGLDLCDAAAFTAFRTIYLAR